jgi:hypothetical protein
MKKTLLFKRILILSLSLMCFSQTGFGQALLVENFEYPASSLLTANGWSAHSGAGTQPITIHSSGLTFTGYPSSGFGNSALVDNTGEDDNKAFSPVNTGTVYCSFLINVTTVAPGYFFHFGENPIGSTFRGKVFLDGTGTNFNFGLTKGSNTPTLTTGAPYATGSTYMLVLKYSVVTGLTNDEVSLFIFSGSIPATEPATPTIGPLLDAAITDLVSVATIAIRQYAATQNFLIDGIRVATNWTDIISDVFPPVASIIPSNSSIDVTINSTPTITFDEAILKTDASAVTNTDLSTLITFKKTDASGADVPFSATIDAAKKVITVTPSANLDNSQLFYLAVGPVEDGFGNHSVLKSVTFTTISATTPVISLTYPAGGEKMYAGQSAIITWTSANIANVFIEVYAPDGTTRISSWISFVPSTPGTDGHADITVPADASYGTEYKIRVSDLSNPAVNSTGANFTVISVSPTLLDLRTRTIANDIVKYTGTATVTFTRPASGGYNQKYIQDATAALVIHDPSNFVGTYAVGDGITNIEGKMSPYLGLIEIVPQAATGTKTTGATIVPEVRTLASLTTADQAKLVKIENLKFTAPTGNFVTGTSYTLDGIAPTSLVFQTLFGEADYITTPTIVPVGYINAVVLVGEKSSVLYITPRNSADMSFATGIDNNLMKNIQLYPVPVLNELNIRNIQNIKGIEILDITGKTVMTMIGNDQTELQIPVSNLTRGMYFIKFTTAKGTVIKRFIK